MRKQIKKFLVATLVFTNLFSATSVFATNLYEEYDKTEILNEFENTNFSNQEYINIWGNINIPVTELATWEQLRSDLAIINSVLSENEEIFMLENSDWISEVNLRLENFLFNVSEEYHNDIIILLMGGNPLLRNSISNFFSSHQRNPLGDGSARYTFRPTFATRTLRATASNAWIAISNHYSFPRVYNSSTISSLNDQYWCHFDFDFETFFFGATWDLETFRPNVGLWQTILALCNP
ncbi:MAG: DUF2599 domain-containing protein [Defluviitaleaceae bacterium]|nr:DUF2599 domain-containing protein [Defluviitaleaceae bacterium]